MFLSTGYNTTQNASLTPNRTVIRSTKGLSAKRLKHKIQPISIALSASEPIKA